MSISHCSSRLQDTGLIRQISLHSQSSPSRRSATVLAEELMPEPKEENGAQEEQDEEEEEDDEEEDGAEGEEGPQEEGNGEAGMREFV